MRKKIILAGVLLTCAMAAILYFALASKAPIEVQPQVAEKKPVAFDFARLLKEHGGSYKKIELAGMARTIDDCLLINSQETLPCATRLASQEKNVELCKRLQESWQAACMNEAKFNIAISSQNPKDCNSLEEASREMCTKEYAVNFKESDRCEIFEDYKQLCADVVVHNVAIAGREAAKCDAISDSQLKSDCSNIIANLPLDSDNDGLADTIELIYEASPFLKDTDNDGLSDDEEIKTYRSMPAEVDSDGDGFNDGDEAKKGFNPVGEGRLE